MYSRWTSQGGPARVDQPGWTSLGGPGRVDQPGWTIASLEVPKGVAGEGGVAWGIRLAKAKLV